MTINRIFNKALNLEEFIDEYYKIIVMNREEYEAYNIEYSPIFKDFNSEADYLRKLIGDTADVEIPDSYRIKLKNLIRRIDVRRERYRDLNEKIYTTGLLYEYSSFFGFLDSIVTFHNQAIIFKEEKALDEEISRNKVKFKALAEKNFSAIVEKIQTSYFNKEFNTFAELDAKLKNLRKIQEKFEITTLLEFTQLTKHIDNDRRIIREFFESHLNWRERDVSDLLELYLKKISIEIRVKNSREKYETLINRKHLLREYIEDILTNRVNAVIIKIDSLANYDKTIIEAKEYNQKLLSERLNTTIMNAEVAAKSKKEIINYIKTIKNYTEFSIEKKIEIVNSKRSFRNIEKFSKLEDRINNIKSKIKLELEERFKRLINNEKYDILKTFTKKNPNLELESELLEYENLSQESYTKINYLKKQRDIINPIKAKMRVISLQPDGQPKLRAIEKFEGEIIRNLDIENHIRFKILSYFEDKYLNLVDSLKLNTENYDIKITDLLQNRHYKIFFRADKIIRIGRRGEPLNDIPLYCKYVEKEHMAIDLKRRKIINYYEQDENNEKIFYKTFVNGGSLIDFTSLDARHDKIELAELFEFDLKTISDEVLTLNFIKTHDINNCNNCPEKVKNCKGCKIEYIETLKNTTFIFIKKDFGNIFFEDLSGDVVSADNYKKKGLEISFDKGKILADCPAFSSEKNMITEKEFTLRDRFNFKITKITSVNY